MDTPKVVTLTNSYGASLEKVWHAWTNETEFAKWWAPEYFSIPSCALDVRPGGKMSVDMLGPDGTVYPSVGEYKEIEPLKKLSFTLTSLDGQGNPLFEVLQEVVFAQEADETRVTVVATVLMANPEAAPYLAGMEEGIRQALNNLKSVV